jgi:hypothetical protein
MKAYSVVVVVLHAVVNLALNGSEWSASHPGRIIPGKSTGIHWEVEWVFYKQALQYFKIELDHW